MQLAYIRDLTPANILVVDQLEDASDDLSLHLKIADFGLAKSIRTSEHVLGTLGYMAPEIFRGEPADPRSDIWSTGMVLWELLSGESPMARRSPEEIARWYFSEDPIPRPAYREEGLPQRLQELALRCLQRNPAERFQTAAALLSALSEVEAEFTLSEELPAYIDLEVTLDMDFASFGRYQKWKFVRELHRLVGNSPPIQIIRTRPGSTKVTLRLSLEQAEQLLWLHRRGVLEDLGMSEAHTLGGQMVHSILEHKFAQQIYDVFMCHNSDDKPAVKRVALSLRQSGILPWLDEWELRPGMPWQGVLEEQLQSIGAAAVFVGNGGIGPWQDMELQAFIRQFVNRGCPVIPVLLRNCKTTPDLPAFLSGMTWVNFKKRSPNPIDHLVWGITGERSLQVIRATSNRPASS